MDRLTLTAHVIAARAATDGDRPLVTEVGGPTFTYIEFHDRCLRWADVLEGVGVRPGDGVLSTLAGPAAFWTWLGAGWLGAVHIPLNPELRGRLLVSAIRTSGARVVVAEAEHVEHLLAAADEVPRVELVLVLDGGAATRRGSLEIVPATGLIAAAQPRPRPDLDPAGIQAGMFTSGTTGPSKCAIRSWAALESSARWLFPTDVDGSTAGGACYNPWPVFHSLGLTSLAVAVQRDLRLVLRRGFSLSRWWSDVREHGCTHAVLLVVGPLLAAEAPRPDDADNPLQHLTIVPLVRDVARFERRFGVQVGTMYGQTETGPVLAVAHPAEYRSVGRPVPDLDVAVVRADGGPVAPGEVGELIARPHHPDFIATTYLGMPDAMADKWIDGWFHTGDAFQVDPDGGHRFVDRLKDCIRHRGHNVSSVELESEVLAYPGVAECACVGVPSELAEADVAGDQDVKAVVVPVPGADVRPDDLVEFLRSRLPRFMLPRYVELVDELPKTPTQRVQKEQLRQPSGRPVWDRCASSNS